MPCSLPCFVASAIFRPPRFNGSIVVALAAGRATLLAGAFRLVARALALTLRARLAARAGAPLLAGGADVPAVSLVPTAAVCAHLRLKPPSCSLRLKPPH